ncbi:MAG: phosphoribosylanthranilate isomerase [Aggregatilineales bacterium]
MTSIKICGLTNLDDAKVALDVGANYLGFIFYAKSPRHVTIEQVEAITARLPSDTLTVGVFVDAPLETIYEARAHCHLKLIQLHGQELPLTVKVVGGAYKAVRPADRDEWERLAALYLPSPPAPFPQARERRSVAVSDSLVHIQSIPHTDSPSPMQWERGPGGEGNLPDLLIDAYHPTLHGGTGQTVDYDIALAAKMYTDRFMLAGGLTPDNLGEIVRVVRPFAVDVSSGVESAPGKKDHGKLRAFVQAVREADKDGYSEL